MPKADVITFYLLIPRTVSEWETNAMPSPGLGITQVPLGRGWHRPQPGWPSSLVTNPLLTAKASRFRFPPSPCH